MVICSKAAERPEMSQSSCLCPGAERSHLSQRQQKALNMANLAAFALEPKEDTSHKGSRKPEMS